MKLKQEDIQRILLAKAIETQPPETALLDAQAGEAATRNALYQIRTGTHGKSDPAHRQALLERRAGLLLEQAWRKAPDLKRLLHRQSNTSLWLWVFPLAALLLGFAGDRIADPYRINLLSAPFLLIVLWNVLAYLWLLSGPLRRKSAADAMHQLPAGLSGWLLRPSWNSHADKAAEKAIAHRFWADWQPHVRPLQGLRLQAGLHLGAAALSLGVLASLWFTGLFTAYRVGWESTFLHAAQVHTLLNALSLPAQWLLGLAPWTLEQVQQLQTWPQSDEHAGLRWVQIYSVLLATLVIVPRTVLAAVCLARLRWRRDRLELPLNTPYFQQLLRDLGSEATTVVVHPYHLPMNEARREAVSAHVRRVYGAAAQCELTAPITYGKEEAFSPAPAPDGQAPTLHALLFNLAATPEPENHGKAMRRLNESSGVGAKAVWLLGHDYTQRIGSTADGQLRLAERLRLWQQFAHEYGLEAQRVDG